MKKRVWTDPLAGTVRRRSRFAPSSGRPQRSTTERGLGHEHQQQRQQLMDAHRDGAPCPCLSLNDCGSACPCRPAGQGLPMYRDPRRNIDGRALEADHALARARGGSRASRLLLSTCNRSRGAGAAPDAVPASSTTSHEPVTSTAW